MIPLSSRRTLIKGLPVGLTALAASSPLWDRLISRAAAQTVTQKRLLTFWIPDGLVPEWFWHSTAGALTIRSDRAQDSELTSTSFDSQIAAADRPLFVLQPIASYSSQILLIKGISNAGGGDHGYSVDSALTGEEEVAKTTTGGPSIDAVMAAANKTSKHIVGAFRTGVYVKQTHLSTSGHPYRDTANATMVEITSSPTTDARVVLDAVSGRAAKGTTTTGTTTTTTGPDATALRAKTRIAALGAVADAIKAMKCTAGTDAANRLDQYTANVQSLENLQQQMSTGMTSTSTTTSPFAVPAAVKPGDATLASYEGDLKHLADIAPLARELAVTALALDYAPAVALHWGATGANKISGGKVVDYRYDFLTGFENKGCGEHGLAHPNNADFQAAGANVSAASSTRDRVRIRRWFFGQMKLILDELSATLDGSGTLMDNTTVLFASEFGGPNANGGAQHSNQNLPYMLVGGKNSPFKLGQALNITAKHGNYLLTLAKGFGSNVTAMGKGTSIIDGILK